MAFVEQIKAFLTAPSKTFDSVKQVNVGSAFRYFLPLLLIFSILVAIISAALLSLAAGIFGTIFAGPLGGALAGLITGPIAALVIFVFAIVLGIIGIFIGGLWLHLWTYIFGGRKGVGQTIKVCMYAFTPTAIIGWIPIISFIAGLWSVILTIIGIRQLHSISTGRAIGAVIISGLILLAILFAIRL
jgi:hypothetical protein